ncbi:Uncharacterised protein [Mycobacteroides abscessus subsp. abscessus]|nr:Uncharacterised protein [Mycobacteroides abscessus subsp. abscessus]SIA88510.1 Uncharacterised protein [Mycobacteroides abscessus subsp. abscessus]SIC65239.1 Uncharacterised protein [Mycobacteroides abscessus subsp. abscessus]SID78775.1 Uncharacterised protein [Mycobacteroides abscessus subsp. abscessus]SKU52659.1 Uncharacterised protein [Mycobacteroides abscessus subsp. abscessus]
MPLLASSASVAAVSLALIPNWLATADPAWSP